MGMGCRKTLQGCRESVGVSSAEMHGLDGCVLATPELGGS